MALYTVDQTHPLASSYTAELSSTAFDAHEELAEVVLGLGEPALTDASDIARLQMAIILQINWMSQFGIDPYVKASEGMSSQASSSVVWRGEMIDPRAMAIVNAVSPQSTKQWYGAQESQSHRTNDRRCGSPPYNPNFERFR